ncbi:p034 [Rhizobium phage 16-3]|uniref:p034 n=2 Tax=root TaxID=1 RepID=UPI00017BA5C6|nr:p034 [Rhizobium phage 16-3]ABF71286.1 p034 [Rhizobium phage 16-3]
MTDSLANGSLPDVTALPPQLKEYADVVFANIFYVGGGVAGAQILAGVLKR